MMNGFHRNTTKQNFWKKKNIHPWHYTSKVAYPQDKAVIQKPDLYLAIAILWQLQSRRL